MDYKLRRNKDYKYAPETSTFNNPTVDNSSLWPSLELSLLAGEALGSTCSPVKWGEHGAHTTGLAEHDLLLSTNNAGNLTRAPRCTGDTSYRHTGHSLLWLQGCLDLPSTPSGPTGKINLGHHRQVRRRRRAIQGEAREGWSKRKKGWGGQPMGLTTETAAENSGNSLKTQSEPHKDSSREFWEQSEDITLKGSGPTL